MIDDLIKPLGQQVGNDRQNYVKSITLESDGSEKISINGHPKELTMEDYRKIGVQSNLFEDSK